MSLIAIRDIHWSGIFANRRRFLVCKFERPVFTTPFSYVFPYWYYTLKIISIAMFMYDRLRLTHSFYLSIPWKIDLINIKHYCILRHSLFCIGILQSLQEVQSVILQFYTNTCFYVTFLQVLLLPLLCINNFFTITSIYFLKFRKIANFCMKNKSNYIAVFS